MTMNDSERQALETELADDDNKSDAIYLFNTKPRKGLDRLCALYGVQPQPKYEAHLLLQVSGLLSYRIGEFLGDPVNERILDEYMRQAGMSNDLVESLRNVLSLSMQLPPEANQVNVIARGFAKAYLDQNPESFESVDAAHILVMALILLNSDLHNSSVMRHMSRSDFVENTKCAPEVAGVSDEYLVQIYSTIRDRPFISRTVSGDEFLAMSAPKIRGKLRKRTNRWVSKWTEYFFVLAVGSLVYHHDDTAASCERPVGMINLVGLNVSIMKRTLILQSTSGSISYVKFKGQIPCQVPNVSKIFLEAGDAKVARKWERRIREAIAPGPSLAPPVGLMASNMTWDCERERSEDVTGEISGE